MLKKFEVKNYKNFENRVAIDFSNVGGYQFSKECILDDVIGKMLIYGKNATGKTNFGRAIMDIKNILVPDSKTDRYFSLNADSIEAYAEFIYDFQFEDDNIQYLYRKNDSGMMCHEELYINGQQAFLNTVATDREHGGLYFVHGRELTRLNVNSDIYVNLYRSNPGSGDGITLPFLRWMINNTALAENSIPMKLYDFVNRMQFVSLQVVANSMLRQTAGEFFKKLEKEDNLNDLERFLNGMGVKCKLELQRLPDNSIQLYFSHKKKVNFMQTASSGTIALLSIFQIITQLEEATFLYIDEFDAFYHYELAEKMIGFLKERYPRCQVVLTTHNTNLMTNRIMRPDCLFILSTFGTLTALCDATPRELREGHNLEKLYISGEFEKYE